MEKEAQHLERNSAMKTTTFKIGRKTVVVTGKRNRVVQNRFGFSKGTTFFGFHFGKASRYLSIPALASRRFGGQADIQGD